MNQQDARQALYDAVRDPILLGIEREFHMIATVESNLMAEEVTVAALDWLDAILADPDTRERVVRELRKPHPEVYSKARAALAAIIPKEQP